MLLAQTFPCQILTGFATANPSFSAPWWTAETEGNYWNPRYCTYQSTPCEVFLRNLLNLHFRLGVNVLPTLSLLDQDFHSSLLQSSWGASVMFGGTRNLFDKTASSEMLMSWQKKKASARRIPVAGEASCRCVVGRERAWLILLSDIVQKQAEPGLCGGLGKILMDLPTILCLLCSRPGDAFLWAVTLVTTLQRWYMCIWYYI